VSHYDVLGVGPSADDATLRRAYLDLARRHHPDREGGDAARMQAINQAWATLSDPARRAQYDRSLHHLITRTAAPGAPDPPRPTRGYEPDPAYPAADLPEDWDEWDDVDTDERPIRATVVLPRWLRMLPAATLGASGGAFLVGVILASEPLLALGLMLLVLSLMFFLSAPFIALLASRRGDRDVDPV
jgi:hypothetical protein